MTTVEEVRAKYEATIVEMRRECEKLVKEQQAKYDAEMAKQVAVVKEQEEKHVAAMAKHEAAMEEIMKKYEQVVKDS